MLGGVSPHFCTLIFCFVQIYVFQNLTFSFSYYSKMCCNILREDDSEIISPLFKKKPIQLKDLFWWKKYVIYFFSCRDNEILLSHLASYIKLGRSPGGGAIFEKFQGGTLFLSFIAFLCYNFKIFQISVVLRGEQTPTPVLRGVGGLSPLNLTYVRYFQKIKIRVKIRTLVYTCAVNLQYMFCTYY